MTKVSAHFDNIRDEILSLIKSSESSIKICMAWFTDHILMAELLSKLDAGFEIEICIFDHESNKRKIADVPDRLENLKKYYADLKSFQEKNGKLNIISQDSNYLHHKFAIIDDKIVITGSYNWTIAATRHKENIVIIEDESIAQQFRTHLEEIVSINHQNIIQNNFSSCTAHHCCGRILKIKIIDFRNTTEYYQNSTYAIGFCTENIEHISILSDKSETDYIGDLIEYEYIMLEDELNVRKLKNKEAIIRRRIESKIAWSLDSRLDIFVDQNSHDYLGLYKITTDMDGDWQIKAIWEHDLIKPYFVEGWENEIIAFLDN